MLSFVSSAKSGLLRFFSKNYASPEIYQKVEKLLDERVRPAIHQDGGDITLHEIIDGVMIVSMHGACEGCGSKRSTLNNGVLGIIRDEIPEIVGIREKFDFEDL